MYTHDRDEIVHHWGKERVSINGDGATGYLYGTNETESLLHTIHKKSIRDINTVGKTFKLLKENKDPIFMTLR